MLLQLSAKSSTLSFMLNMKVLAILDQPDSIKLQDLESRIHLVIILCLLAQQAAKGAHLPMAIRTQVVHSVCIKTTASLTESRLEKRFS